MTKPKLIPRKKVKVSKSVLEGRIQRAVVEYAQKLGWRTRKRSTLGAFGTNGEPDYEFMRFPRQLFFIEFKAPGELPSKLQLERHAELRHCGFMVFVVDDVGDGKRVIDRMSLDARSGLGQV